MKTTYELYYNDGGHGGPYPDFKTANEAAERLLKGSQTTTTIEIRPRASESIGGFKDKNHGSTYLDKYKNGLVSARLF